MGSLCDELMECIGGMPTWPNFAGRDIVNNKLDQPHQN